MALTLIHPIFNALGFLPLPFAILLSLPLSRLGQFFGGRGIAQDVYDVSTAPRNLRLVYLATILVFIGFFASLFFTQQFITQCIAAFALPMFAWDLLGYWNRSLRTEYNQHF